MKIKKMSGKAERTIIIGMITNKTVLAAIADRWDRQGLFESRWPNLVGTWCVAHYRKYNKAPGQRIENIFDRWAAGREGKDKDTVKLIEKFLSSISGQYAREKKKTQAQFIIDLASEHFNAVRCSDVCEEAQGLIEDGRITEALSLMEGFKKVEMGAGSKISVLEDKSAIKRSFLHKSVPVIKYDGALGTFFGDALERDSFILFHGPEKRGKTWIMLEMAWKAMMLGKRVAFFEVGDLSEAQIMRRFMVRAAQHPLNPTKKGHPLLVPIGLTIRDAAEGAKKASVVHKHLKFKRGLKWQQAWKACLKITKPWGEGQELLRLGVYPNTSISINGIASQLDLWSNDGWVPDLLVIDYLDILAPIDSKTDVRHQVDATCRGMRSLSQVYHLCLISCTQTNAASYEAVNLSMKHFSESKTKNAHVTGLIGINQTEEEKKMGIYRLNWNAGREWEYSSSVCVYTAGCLGLASPFMLSSF